MPHLRFDLSTDVTDDERATFARWVAETYADVMDTGTGHVGVVVTETAPALGRASAGDDVALVNADVREGRTTAQRHRLARLFTDELGDRFDVPAEHCYVVFTEHAGEEFVLGGDPLDSWDAEEGDGADPTDA